MQTDRRQLPKPFASAFLKHIAVRAFRTRCRFLRDNQTIQFRPTAPPYFIRFGCRIHLLAVCRQSTCRTPAKWSVAAGSEIRDRNIKMQIRCCACFFVPSAQRCGLSSFRLLRFQRPKRGMASQPCRVGQIRIVSVSVPRRAERRKEGIYPKEYGRGSYKA